MNHNHQGPPAPAEPRPCVCCRTLTRGRFGAVWFDRGLAIEAPVCCECIVGARFLTRADRALARRLDRLGIKLATFEPCEWPESLYPPPEPEP